MLLTQLEKFAIEYVYSQQATILLPFSSRFMPSLSLCHIRMKISVSIIGYDFPKLNLMKGVLYCTINTVSLSLLLLHSECAQWFFSWFGIFRNKIPFVTPPSRRKFYSPPAPNSRGLFKHCKSWTSIQSAANLQARHTSTSHTYRMIFRILNTFCSKPNLLH